MSMPAGAFAAAVQTVEAANREEVPLKLLGGQAVRYLTPDFPPRQRDDQDMDFASVSKAKRAVMALLGGLGFEGDRRFNTMHGHKQMYFRSPVDGATADVIMDRLQMCHVLEFGDRIDRLPFTLDVTDLLLSKLQVVEQNEKDVQDIVYLLAAHEVREGDEPGTVGLARFAKVLAEDWGWWRTATGNLDRVVELVRGDLARLVPRGAGYDPVEQAVVLRDHAQSMPKTLKWKLRARLGERVQWYEVPEEVAH
ncbi:MAG TPA: hypothetical protein VFL71_00295 [Actinomycetes bacterium]|jgi:hypothetical protein|nr:hypothetical protein [Actinomycetes bacterium]